MSPPRHRSRKPHSGLHCVIDERGDFRCDVVPGAQRSKIVNESAQPGCYLNTSSGRWECDDVPSLHRSVAPKPTDQQRDSRYNQGWASVGASNIPVTAYSVTVGKRRGATTAMLDIISKIIPSRRSAFPLSVGRRRRSRRRRNPLQCPPGTVWRWTKEKGDFCGVILADPWGRPPHAPPGGLAQPTVRFTAQGAPTPPGLPQPEVEFTARPDVLPPDIRPPADCCVDKTTMQIVCTNASNPWHGVDVSLNASCFEQEGQEVCFIDLGGDANVTLPLCTVTPPQDVPPKVTPPKVTPPRDCCFNVATLAIICADTSDPFHGVVVPETTVSIGTDAQGQPYADISVSGDQRIQMPVCDRPDLLPPPGVPEPPGPPMLPPPGVPEPPRPPMQPPPGVPQPPGGLQPPPGVPQPPGIPQPPGVPQPPHVGQPPVPPGCPEYTPLCGDPGCPTCNFSAPPTGVPLEAPCCGSCANGLACENACPSLGARLRLRRPSPLTPQLTLGGGTLPSPPLPDPGPTGPGPIPDPLPKAPAPWPPCAPGQACPVPAPDPG